MKKTLFIVLVLCSALVSCNKMERERQNPDRETARVSKVVVDIQGLPMLTKAEYQTADEKKISMVDIAVYDAAGVLEWTKHYTDSRSSRQVITGLSAGRKTIAVVANAAVEMPTVLDAFNTKATDLKENSLSGGFVMTGTVEAVASEEPQAVTLKLQRVAAKISMEGTITTDWIGDAPASFDITDIYVANVSTLSSYSYNGTGGPSVNLRSTEELTADAAYRAFTVATKSSWHSGEAFNGGVNFYVYPNSDSARTCLIIKALYDGVVTYYPIEIEQDIRNNTLYDFGDVVITCQGVDHPWEKFTRVMASFSLVVNDWNYTELDNYTF